MMNVIVRSRFVLLLLLLSLWWLQNEDELPSNETLHWADGFLLVYSITDRQSFNYVRKVKEMLDCFDTPITLVGNKADMVHLRQVSADEGKYFIHVCVYHSNMATRFLITSFFRRDIGKRFRMLVQRSCRCRTSDSSCRSLSRTLPWSAHDEKKKQTIVTR